MNITEGQKLLVLSALSNQPKPFERITKSCDGYLTPTEVRAILVALRDNDEAYVEHGLGWRLGRDNGSGGVIAQAGSLLAAVFGDGMTASMIGGHFTCSEAENIANALHLLEQHEAADLWLDCHAEGDDDPDDLHYRGEQA